MPVTVEALNPRAKALYGQVKQFITEKIAPVEQDYVRHSKSADRWKVFEPVEKLKVRPKTNIRGVSKKFVHYNFLTTKDIELMFSDLLI